MSRRRKLRGKFDRNRVLDHKTVKHLAGDFREFGTVAARPHYGSPRTGRSMENIRSVRDSVEQEPKTSVSHRAQEFSVSSTILHNILTTRCEISYHVRWTSWVWKTCGSNMRYNF
ncbi:hypothetical protein WH47_00092 [Habropoda laboriosa]|uniref:Uncharacterized protein n=1 Tax=Habropoda laboriosa TaxID=597456 RepID=A0A0L7QK99_9HYME|nr:hypothetical protein WH47_00092 [Habropoda laboriosa]